MSRTRRKLDEGDDDQFDVPPPFSASTSWDKFCQISHDGRRITTKILDTKPVKVSTSSASTSTQPTTSSDAYSRWEPSLKTSQWLQDHDIDSGATVGNDMPDAIDSEDSPSHEADGKRKRYESSDDPMKTWLPMMPVFLDELLRRDGLGDALSKPECCICHQAFCPSLQQRLFRCRDCGEEITCLKCVLKGHSSRPLHRVQEWNGDFWEDRTLRNLGLVYQLGHSHSVCPGMGVVRTMVVIEFNGIHTVSYRYCTCRSVTMASNIEQLLRCGWYPATITDPSTCATIRVLDLFRLLKVVGNVNCDVFMKTLVAQSDPYGLEQLPDRNGVFFRIERQYAYLLRLKRSGRPYRPPYPGDAAVLCWGCPQDGINMEPNWLKDPPEKQYLNMLIVAVDANFRLKNRIRKGVRTDPPLESGSAYFVEINAYKSHLQNYVAEKDISTCIAFAALTQKETRLTTGLRTSGVVGVVCARHELVRPLGIGDLQKGERYSNVDFVLFSSIQGTTLRRVAMSYDIVCQYKQNLPKRIPNLPESLHTPSTLQLQFGLPTWHAAVHKLACRTENALGLQDGVGRTDGEAIERTWSLLNPAAWSTKEMGEGARQDALDDKIDFLNFHKNIIFGRTLSKRLIIASEELDRQKANYEQVTSSLRKRQKKKWQRIIDAWKKDRNSPNPFLLGGKGKNPTEAEVRLALQKEDLEEAKAGKTVIHQTTPTAFLTAGLQIESIQYKVVHAATSSSLTVGAESKLQERRASILSKLKPFRERQQAYMPGAARCMSAAEEKRDGNAVPPNPEHITLWLPSNLPQHERNTGCSQALFDAEARLREAQCSDALTQLRRHLRSKQYLIDWRNANAVGQGMATRSRTLIDTLADKVTASASKYRLARQAFITLKEADKASHLPELQDSDLTPDIIVEDDELSQRRLAALTSKTKRVHKSTGRDTLSWIWTTSLSPEDQKLGTDEVIRVQWSRSQFRVARWTEEVEIITTEMRRVLRFLSTAEQRWRAYAESSNTTNPTPALVQGRRAYALRQASFCHRIREHFDNLWSMPSIDDANPSAKPPPPPLPLPAVSDTSVIHK